MSWASSLQDEVNDETKGELAEEQRTCMAEAARQAQEEEAQRRVGEEIQRKRARAAYFSKMREEADTAVSKLSGQYINFEADLRSVEIDLLPRMTESPELASGFVAWAHARGVQAKSPADIFAFLRIQEQIRLLEGFRETLEGNPLMKEAEFQIQEVFRRPHQAPWGWNLPDVGKAIEEARENVSRVPRDGAESIDNAIGDLLVKGFDPSLYAPALEPLKVQGRHERILETWRGLNAYAREESGRRISQAETNFKHFQNQKEWELRLEELRLRRDLGPLAKIMRERKIMGVPAEAEIAAASRFEKAVDMDAFEPIEDKFEALGPLKPEPHAHLESLEPEPRAAPSQEGEVFEPLKPVRG